MSTKKETEKPKSSTVLGNIMLLSGIILFCIGGAVFTTSYLIHKDTAMEDVFHTPIASHSPYIKTPLNAHFIFSTQCESCKILWNDTLLPLSETYPHFAPNISLFPLQPEGEDMEWSILLHCATQQDISRAKITTDIWQYPPEKTKIEHITEKNNLNVEALEECIKDPSMVEAVFKKREKLLERGVRGTPTLFLRGEKHEGMWPKENIELEILKEEK